MLRNFLDCLYRKKQTRGVPPKSQKTMLKIELQRNIIFYIHHNRCGGNLSGVQEHTLQSVH